MQDIHAIHIVINIKTPITHSLYITLITANRLARHLLVAGDGG